MAYQTAANVLVAVRREDTPGTQATATGATQVRIIDSPGLVFERAPIQAQEKRADGLAQMGRLGGKRITGSFNAELSVGGATDLFAEAVMRSTWATSTSIGFASVTSITCGSNEVVGAGDWVAQGIRVGDVFRLSGYSTAANNDKNLRVTAITSSTLSVPAGSLTSGAADTAGTLTVLGKLTNPATPTRYSHTFEQYDADIDLSEIFIGCRIVGMRYSLRPNEMATVSYTILGTDHDDLASGASPYFTSPSLTTGLGLIADDSFIYKDGVAIATFTGLELNFEIAADLAPVIGSFVSPDVFDNNLTISGSVTGLRSDFSRLTEYEAETEFSLSVLLEEPASSGAKPCHGIYLPRVKFGSLSAPVGGGDGPKVETLDLMVGPKTASTGHDGTGAVFHSSAE